MKKSMSAVPRQERIYTNMSAEQQRCKQRIGHIVEVLEELGYDGKTKLMCRASLSTIEQEVSAPRVRLFEWNESLLQDKYLNCGIIMIRVINKINNTINPDFDDIFVGHEKYQLTGLFKLSNLLLGDSMKSVVLKAIVDTNAFVKHSVVEDLAQRISFNLSSNFQFNETTLAPASPSTRRIIVLIEVDMFTTKEYRVIKDDETMNRGCGNDVSVGVAADDNQGGFMESESREEKDAELMDIEGTIWKFLGDLAAPEIIRGEREFSCGSKGLKEVESPIEIITDFCDGNVSQEVDLCPCCLDKIVVEGKVVAKTPCLHLLHRDCLYFWLSTHDSCPLCRSKCATYV